MRKNRGRIVQANALTMASYRLTMIEKRLFYLILSLIYVEDRKRSLSEACINQDKGMIVNLCLSDLYVIHNHVTKASTALRTLCGKKIEIMDNKQKIQVAIFNQVNRIDRNRMEVEVSSEILPYVLMQSKQFTQLDLFTALRFQSVYSQRFYELCKLWKNKGFFFCEIDTLKNMFGISEKYRNNNDLFKNVISVAEDELRNSFNGGFSDVYFEWRIDGMTKLGKRVTRLHFVVKSKNANENKTDYCLLIMQELSEIFPTHRRFIGQFSVWLQQNKILAESLYQKISTKKAKYSKDALPKILRKTIEEDYNITFN